MQSTLREESNAGIWGINFRESPLLSFFARMNFLDLAKIEKLNAVFSAEKKYQRRKIESTKINFMKSTYFKS